MTDDERPLRHMSDRALLAVAAAYFALLLVCGLVAICTSIPLP